MNSSIPPLEAAPDAFEELLAAGVPWEEVLEMRKMQQQIQQQQQALEAAKTAQEEEVSFCLAFVSLNHRPFVPLVRIRIHGAPDYTHDESCTVRAVVYVDGEQDLPSYIMCS